MFSKAKDYLKKNRLKLLISLIISIITMYIWQGYLQNKNQKIERISYETFMELVDNHKVDRVDYSESNEWMTVYLFNDDTKNLSLDERLKYNKYTESDQVLTQYPGTETNFREKMLKKDVLLTIVPKKTTFFENILNVISLALPIFWIIVIVSLVKSTMSFGDINKKELIQTSDVRFDDIIGHDEILDDIKFITELIQHPEKGDSIGAKVPKGILLSGDPGCGKTLIAKAIAGEANVPFIYQNASSFIDRVVGVGAKHVRDLFKIAKQHTPCIIFIDEIDAIGGKRGENKGTSENEQTINALLQEMDGFKGRDGIFIIAATNRADSLDDALVRSGRFDRCITVNPPRDWTVRKRLFEHYLKNFKVTDDIDLDSLSKQVSGSTGADIAMFCNEASIVAIMHNKDAIDTDCIEEAIDKKMFNGNRSKSGEYEVDRNIVAYHEAGHAVMTYLVGQPIAVASIQPTTSGVGGYVKPEDNTKTIFQTADDLKNSVLIAYAGRASEEIKFGKITTGSSNDITKGSHILSTYIEKLGFDHEFGLLDISVLTQNHLISSDKIVERLATMSRESYAECKSKLEENYHLVEKIAAALLEKSKLSGIEIKRLLKS